MQGGGRDVEGVGEGVEHEGRFVGEGASLEVGVDCVEGGEDGEFEGGVVLA